MPSAILLIWGTGFDTLAGYVKIKELIEELQKWPPDDEVFIPEMNMSGLIEAKSVTNHPFEKNAVQISENE